MKEIATEQGNHVIAEAQNDLLAAAPVSEALTPVVASRRYVGQAEDRTNRIATEQGHHVIAETRRNSLVEATLTVARTPAMTSPSYIDLPPGGIGAEQAWQAGFNGQNLTVVVCDTGCLRSHPNLPTPEPFGAGEFSGLPLNVEHGTAVVGVVAAKPDPLWQPTTETGDLIVPEQMWGIGQGASVLVASPRIRVEGVLQVRPEEVIKAAVNNRQPMHVLLIEEQSEIKLSDGSTINVPVERREAVHSAIKDAVAKGIVVIEVAGNDGRGLSTLNTNLDDHGEMIDDQGNPTGKNFNSDDSGAIVVSAVGSGGAHERLFSASHGRRVDVYAWGDNVKSCTLHEGDEAEPGFVLQPTIANTSAAGAIAAGVVLLMQRMSMQHRDQVLEPLQVRELLRNCGTGIIGTNRFMPDLAKLCRAIRSIPADDVSAATATTMAQAVQLGTSAALTCWS